MRSLRRKDLYPRKPLNRGFHLKWFTLSYTWYMCRPSPYITQKYNVLIFTASRLYTCELGRYERHSSTNLIKDYNAFRKIRKASKFYIGNHYRDSNASTSFSAPIIYAFSLSVSPRSSFWNCSKASKMFSRSFSRTLFSGQYSPVRF